MGQTLSEPITTKETTSIRNESLVVASSSMQGWRVTMEDAHQHILQLSPEDSSAAYFAVFDGHGGSMVARHASINLHRHIVNRAEYQDGDIPAAIREGFLECDRAMKGSAELKDEMAGCTAVTVLVKDNKLFCGNAGDSRCIAGVCGEAVALSNDHKPNDPSEMERIVNAGGFVECNRVNGNLALSRALGDFIFKTEDKLPQNKQIVSAEPDVQEHEISEDLDFVLLACDGIWDVLNNQQVCDFVLEKLAADTQPGDVCEQLMDKCLAPDCQVGGLGCDNMTVVLVCFLHGKQWSSLVDKCGHLYKARLEQKELEPATELEMTDECNDAVLLRDLGDEEAGAVNANTLPERDKETNELELEENGDIRVEVENNKDITEQANAEGSQNDEEGENFQQGDNHN